jgi:hypothetical protein
VRGLWVAFWLDQGVRKPRCRWLGKGGIPGFCRCRSGGLVARLARVVRRRRLVWGGSPAAARLLVSAWRVSQAVRMRWLRVVSRRASRGCSGVRPVRRHPLRAMLLVAGSLMVAKVGSELVRRA